MPESGKAFRIMHIESETEGLNGPVRIGRVTFRGPAKMIYYKDQEFLSFRGFKVNYLDTANHEECWISGPRRDGEGRLYVSNLPNLIDGDVRVEYWT